MALTQVLDFPAAQRLWDAGQVLPADGRNRLVRAPDPVRALALESAVRTLCLDLFAVDTALGEAKADDFWLEQFDQDVVSVCCSAQGEYVLHRHLLEALRARLTDNGKSIELQRVDMDLPVTTAGRLIGTLLPYRRKVIVQNMRRVYGERISPARLERLMLAHYSHLATLLRELVTFRFRSHESRMSSVRVEGVQTIIDAFEAGQGMLVLTGHFGNFEVSTVCGIEHFPMAKGRIHFLRRPIKPKWLSDFLTRRFNKAGFGVIGRRGSLDEIVTRIEAGDAIVFPFDQYARKPEGIEVSLFGQDAGTYKSMAVIAMATGAPVIPGSSWREPDGTHVLKFWSAVMPIHDDDVGKEIALNTRQYNRALEQLILRKPAQWWWVHRRWKNQPAST